MITFDEKKVKKAMNPQEQAMFSNALSLLTEIDAMSQGGAPAADPVEPAAPETPPVPAAAKGDTVENPNSDDAAKIDAIKAKVAEVNEIMKTLVTTPSDGATASDPAEQQLAENQPEEDKAQIQQVAKSVAGLGANQSAQFQAMAHVNQETLKALKAEKAKNAHVSETLETVMKGLGLMDQFEKTQQEATAKAALAAENKDPLVRAAKAMEALAENIGKSQNAPAAAPVAAGTQAFGGGQGFVGVKKSLTQSLTGNEDVQFGASVLKSMVCSENDSLYGLTPDFK